MRHFPPNSNTVLLNEDAYQDLRKQGVKWEQTTWYPREHKRLCIGLMRGPSFLANIHMEEQLLCRH